MSKRTWAAWVAAVLFVALCVPAFAAAGPSADDVAVEYVTAFQKGDWARAQAVCGDAALSFVEYVAAREGQTDGITAVTGVESSPLGENIRIKVYYTNAKNQLRVRYVKVRDAAGRYVVVDDKMLGGEWVSSSYVKGLFSVPQQIDGVRLTVLGVLEMPPEVKIDFKIENISGKDKVMVLPSLESFYIVEADGSVKQKYYATVPPEIPETPIARGAAIRSYAIFPYWAHDPIFAGKSWKALKWTLYVPFGPVDQFAIEYM